MGKEYGQINGLKMMESKEFIEELNKIEGIKCNLYLQESGIEFKSIFTPFIIEITKDVAIGLVVALILKFFEKNKNKERISIKIGNVTVLNGDNNTIINEKLSKIKENGD